MFPVKIVRPDTLKDVWLLVKNAGGPVKFLAGGTDLAISAHCGRADGETWIDIGALAELKGIRLKGKKLYIGACEKVSALGENALVRKHAPVLFDSVRQYASPPLRNIATLGGNCGNASPSADGVCALVAEGADALLFDGKTHSRRPVEKLFAGPKRTVLKPGQLITGFEIPIRGGRGVYLKLAARKNFAISKICMGVSLKTGSGAINDIRISLGAVGPTVKRALKAEKILLGVKLDEKILDLAARAAVAAAAPIDDQRSTAAYRKAMAGVLLKRALRALCA
ncbi:MAG: FAD binding domain-containing protein [Elusimicrobiaceae bacterium]|nr:FAD binding domain-containing protein [Elusimicrobiaceae bacterium]